MSVCSPSSELPDAYHSCSPTQRSEQKKETKTKQQNITHSLLKSCYMARSVKALRAKWANFISQFFGCVERLL